MKITSKLLIIAGLLFVYLVASYYLFYFYIGKKSLKSPYSDEKIYINLDKLGPILNYVALGDSLTVGVGSNAVTDTYVYMFGALLSKKNSNVAISNFGIPGASTTDVISKELPKLSTESPNYVSLLIGLNDIHNRYSLNRFSKNYDFILDELLTKTSAEIYVLTIPFIGSSKLLLPPFDYLMNTRTKLFNNEIKRLIASKNSPRLHLIDIYENTYSLTTDPKYYSADLYHPSNYGYSLWKPFIYVN